jgi:ABC-2 type transport system ATP-binding protein
VLSLGHPAPITTQSQFVSGTPEPGGAGQPATAVRLDTTLYLPAHTPAPAVLLAHGFGGSKSELDGPARAFARQGYVVLTYTARGFGRSGGLIHLDSPDYEVADASLLVTWLATKTSDVELDAPGDPRIGVAGSSYGGGLALLLAGTDPRIDAVDADITWNELSQALFPQSATIPETAGGPGLSAGAGVFKRVWASQLFASGSSNTGNGDPAAGCGRFAADICALYQRSAQTGVPDDATLALLHASSPASILSNITAPTLLTQGEQDSLFPLDQADANARGIAANGTPVQVRWRAGGHDVGGSPAFGPVRDWFATILKDHQAPPAVSPFSFDRSGAGLSAATGRSVTQTIRASTGYPGTAGAPAAALTTYPLRGGPQLILAPAGGSPAAISSLPGLGGVLSAAGLLGGGASALTAPVGQVAAFTSEPLTDSRLIVGSSTVRITVTPAPGNSGSTATLFIALHDLSPDGAQSLPAGLVAPVLLHDLTPGVPVTVDVRLPGIVDQVASGHRLRVTVATTDLGYLLPTAPAAYTISLATGSSAGTAAVPLSVPTVDGETIRSGSAAAWLIVGVLAVVLAILLAWLVPWWMRRRSLGASQPNVETAGEPDEPPLVVENLIKDYRGGGRAVDGVSFTVLRGQVVGLLGPNGAGKTTTLRMVMGLIRPTSGQIRVFGQIVEPGAPVLSRLGAFVEGAGFLPHLSGRDNLRLFWAATGRPSQHADVETALEIAGLGTSIDRKVRTYSQGMRQRLAIAQAMLGLPEVLVLDEPTNGLDPPQIAEMRRVLRRYADTGRTVIVSSHLLSEVEQTCSHVVVMHRGRVVSAGTVSDIAGSGSMQLAVPDPVRAAAVLAAAGITSTQVPARRALEEVFLQLVGEGPDGPDGPDATSGDPR